MTDEVRAEADELKVGDFVSFSNTGGNASATTKVVSIASDTVIVVNPAIGTVGGFHCLAAAGGAATAKIHKMFPTGYIFDLTANGAGGTLRTSTINSSTQMTMDLKETIANTTSMTVFFNNKRESANCNSINISFSCIVDCKFTIRDLLFLIN